MESSNGHKEIQYTGSPIRMALKVPYLGVILVDTLVGSEVSAFEGKRDSGVITFETLSGLLCTLGFNPSDSEEIAKQFDAIAGAVREVGSEARS